MSAKVALVTLAVGKGYAARWAAYCRPNWQQYAERHGYDLLCLDAPLDTSARARGRSPAWQKCLVLGQAFARRYERIVWMDADIVLNPLAPSLVDGVPAEMVGAVDEYASPTPALHAQSIQKLYHFWDAHGVPYIRNETARDYYTVYGLPQGFAGVVQTGVLVLSPQRHRALLEHTYYAYEQRGSHEWNYEMRPLSYELLKAGCVHWLDPRFNAIWPSYKSLYYPFLVTQPEHPRAAHCAVECLSRVYALHFVGGAEMDRVAPNAHVQTEVLPPLARAAGEPADGWRLRAPVALFIFARPDTTQQVFDAIRRVRPPRLYIVADGPRPDRPGEAERCAAARAVVQRVDWQCDVRTDFSEVNLGVKLRLAGGLDWVFAHEPEAIILEDDCLAHPTFFRFCDELLERYRDDPRVMTISGNNFQFGRRAGSDSYYYSRYPHIWGWASWRRAWRLYDPDMRLWPCARDGGLLARTLARESGAGPHAQQYWNYIFQSNYDGFATWDYPLVFAGWLHGRLHILPAVNLVSNIGFGAGATHTDDAHSLFAGLPAEALEFPLRHPCAIERDEAADAFTESIMFGGTFTRLFARIRARRQTPAASGS